MLYGYPSHLGDFRGRTHSSKQYTNFFKVKKRMHSQSREQADKQTMKGRAQKQDQKKEAKQGGKLKSKCQASCTTSFHTHIPWTSTAGDKHGFGPSRSPGDLNQGATTHTLVNFCLGQGEVGARLGRDLC